MSTTTLTRNNNGTATVGKRVDLGLSQESVEGVVSILTRALSDVQVLYVKSLYVHWNIHDSSFYGIHTLLEEQYNALKEAGDTLAERVRSYGVPVIGSMSNFLAHTRLEEMDEARLVGSEALEMLAADHEAVVRQLRQDIERCEDEYGDMGAADLLTGYMQTHQEMAWMWRSFLGH